MKVSRVNGLGIPLFLALAGVALCWCVGTLVAAEGPKAAIKIRVVDSVTRSEVNGAEVSVRLEGDAGLKKVGVTTNGIVEFAPVNDDRMIEFCVEANGYRDRTTLVTVEKQRIAEISLLPTEFKLKGVVVAPAGQLASGAKIGFAHGNDPMVLEANVHVRGGLVDPWHFSGATVLANSDGSFEATPPQRTSAIMVVHEFGCGSASTIGWTNGTTIQLRPWVSLRGRMVINGKPAANRLIAAVLCSVFNTNTRFYLRNFDATTDAEGKFVFDRLPAGVIDVVQKVQMADGGQAFSHWSSFVADASLPATEVVYNLVGRDISGVLTDGEGHPVDWHGLNIFAMLTPTQSNHAIDEFVPMAGGAPGRPAQYFVPVIDGDGKFSAEAIPPGEYALLVNCADRGRPIQQMSAKISVPQGDGAFRVGKISATNSRP